jgi:transposase
LVTRRRELVEMLTAERNRLGSVPRELHREIRAHIRWLEARLKERDRDLDRAPQLTAVARTGGLAPQCAGGGSGVVCNPTCRVARTG